MSQLTLFETTPLVNDRLPTESYIESIVAQELDRLGVPIETQYPLGRYRGDIVIPSLRLIFELDGYKYHSTRQAFTADRRRDRALKLKDWDTLRYSADELLVNERYCIAEMLEHINKRAG